MDHIIEVGTATLSLSSKEVKVVRERVVFYYQSKEKYIPKRIRLNTVSGKPVTNGPPSLDFSLKEDYSVFFIPFKSSQREFSMRTQGE